MFLLVLRVCLHVQAASSSESGEEATYFALYAGNLEFSNKSDGSCIACNGSCSGSTAVRPHSWTADLVYERDNVTYYNDLEMCRGYAHAVNQYGVKAFTWKYSTRTCSLHVLDVTYNIGAEMTNYNGFEWIEENVDNTGSIILVTYPKTAEEVDTSCYYGLDINETPNITKEGNVGLIIFVVVTIIAWNGWMNHTDNYPPFISGHGGSPETSEDDDNKGQGIYTDDSRNTKHA